MTTASGRRLFLKAVGPKPNPDSPDVHQEDVFAAVLPPDVPSPRLLWSLDEGPGGWVVLAFEDAGGRPPRLPWREDELGRVVGAIEAMHQALTPSPIEAPDAGEVMAEAICGWRILACERPAGLDPWSARHLHRLARLETGVAEAVRGDTLVHMDLRADNLLLCGRRVWVVDWPHARRGAPWLDAVAMAPSVAMQGGPGPEAFLRRFPSAAAADAASVDAAVAAIAGYFTRMSLSPPPPGLPTLRAFQAPGGGRAALAWGATWPRRKLLGQGGDPGRDAYPIHLSHRYRPGRGAAGKAPRREPAVGASRTGSPGPVAPEPHP